MIAQEESICRRIL